MIRSKTNTSEQVFDSFSLNKEITVLGGSPRQMFYTNEQTYEDDRRYVPCILGGYVYVNDPAGVMTGEQELTDIEWYTQMPIEGDYNTGRIVNPSQSVLDDVDVYDQETGEITHEAAWRSADYLISDGSDAPWCADVPAKCLIVRKNVPQLTSMPIYGVLKFLNQHTGLIMRVICSKDFTTESYNTDVVTMRGNCGDELMLNPLSFTDTIPSGQTILDVPWTRVISAQLQGGEGDVADNKACYVWLIEESNTLVAPTGWRELNELEKKAMSITGEHSKTLSLDTRLIRGSIALRCYGCRRDAGAAWANPLNDENSPFYQVRLTMAVPGSTPTSKRKPKGDATTAQEELMSQGIFDAKPVQVTGNHQNTAMSIPVHYEMELHYNGKSVPANKRALYLFHWYGKNLKTGEEVFFGCGPTLDFIPNQWGFTFPDGFAVWGNVAVLTSFGVVVDGTSYVNDSDGKLVISGIFE